MATHNKVFLKKTGTGFAVTTRSEQQRRQAEARRSAVQLARAIATPPPGYFFPGQSAAAAVQARTMGRPGARGKEIKSFDCTIHAGDPCVLVAAVAGTAVNANPVTGMVCINTPIAGSAFSERVGSRIVVKSIAVKMMINPAATTAQNTVRVMIVYDRQVNKQFAGIGDLLAVNASAPTFSAGINIQNKNRFLVLRDSYVPIDAAQGLCKYLSFYVKGRWDTEFSASAGSVADITTGAIYVVWFMATQVGAGALNVTEFNTRIRYDDS